MTMIQHKRLEGALVATQRLALKDREQLPEILEELQQRIPPAHIAGPPFCTFQFVTSVQDGLDATVGFPVTQAVDRGPLTTQALPSVEVLSLVHRGPIAKLREAYGQLYGYTSERGIISDEFCREVYWNWADADDVEVELQFVVHDWNGLLARNLERVLGADVRQQVMQGVEALTVESRVAERFCWVKGALERLEGLAGERDWYDVLSGCAHVFPSGQVDKLRQVYLEARSQAADPLAAVDAVIAFMGEDPGWVEAPSREGYTIYGAKKPANPAAYEKAQTEADKRKAYCFCPLLREHLDEGMPSQFCYCGSGWYRQQWEGAIGRPVRIDIVKSVLRGDDVCQFAIHLPDDLS